METTSLFATPTTSALDNMAASESSQYLKLEDLHTTASSSPAPSLYEVAADSQISPPPVVVQSRQAKKRKSWGQELPEPKTTLPPRKRAKTDDEKEQRRIERIKRNRAAAHNSRERKRQETETLAVALARANAELDAYRNLHGPLPANIVLPEVTLCMEDPDTPAPSLVESRGTDDGAPSPASPTDNSFDHSSIKQEPFDTTFPAQLSPTFDNLDANNVVRPAVSVDPPEPQQQHDEEQRQPEFVNYGGYLVDQTLPLPDDLAASDMLQDYLGSSLDNFAFSDGASDASFNPPLFNFEDLIDIPTATVAVDAQASGAA